jgi:hypothetical protein
LWLIKVWFSASTFVVKIATFAKPENVTTNAKKTYNTATMTKNADNIQIVSTKRTVLQTDRFLHLKWERKNDENEFIENQIEFNSCIYGIV